MYTAILLLGVTLLTNTLQADPYSDSNLVPPRFFLAHSPKHVEFDQTAILRNLVESSLKSDEIDLAILKRVNQIYEELPRTSIDMNKVREMKFMLSDWRVHMKNRVMRLVTQRQIGSKIAMDALELVKPRLSGDEMRKLHVLSISGDGMPTFSSGLKASGISPKESRPFVDRMKIFLVPEYRDMPKPKLKEQAANLFADFQGDYDVARRLIESLQVPSALKRLGPQPLKRVGPYKANVRTNGLEWILGRRKMPDLDQYHFTDRHTVLYKGIKFKTGDMFLADLGLADDGGLTSFTSPRSIATHTALFVIFEKDDKWIPAVLEIHQKGNRVVPLANFLGRHTYYGEAYRPQGRDPAWRDLLSKETWDFMKYEFLAYDFEGKDPPKSGRFAEGEMHCATCVGLPLMMYHRAGFHPKIPKSVFHPGVIVNLEEFGLGSVKGITAPTDIARSPDFRMVDVFDSNQLQINLARELIVGDPSLPHTIGHAFAHRLLKSENLPRFAREEMEIRIAQAENPIARGITLLSGYDHRVIPQAPPRVVAFYLSSKRDIAGASEHLSKNCQAMLADLGNSRKPLSVNDLEKRVGESINEAITKTGVNLWSVPR